MSKKNSVLKKEKGIALIWTLVTISVLLLITASMATLIVSESQMSVGIDGSIKAYAGAESGLEHAGYLIKDTPNTVSLPCGIGTSNYCSIGEQQYQFNVDPEIDVITLKPVRYKIQSLGKSVNVSRKIEQSIDITNVRQPIVRSYSSDPVLSADSPYWHSTDWLNNGSSFYVDINNESYTQVFGLKTAGGLQSVPSNRRFAIGLRGNSLSGGIYAKFYQKSSTSSWTVPNETEIKIGEEVATDSSTDGSITFSENKFYKIYIQYLKKTAVKIKINELSTENGVEIETCIFNKTKLLPATYNPIGFFNRIVFFNGTSTTSNLVSHNPTNNSIQFWSSQDQTGYVFAEAFYMGILK